MHLQGNFSLAQIYRVGKVQSIAVGRETRASVGIRGKGPLNEQRSHHLPRPAPRWRPFRLKSVRVSDVHHAINWRAELAEQIAGKVESGRLGVVRDGMDCDCTQYHREYAVDFRGLVAFARYESDHYDSLDGRESTRYASPSDIDRARNASRDLALEAFEDGHPHVVYAGAF